jgi:hypothetical protein
LEAKKLAVLREKERIKIDAEKRSKDAAAEKKKAKDDEREKRKKEAEEERKTKDTRKKQKKNESHQSYRQLNQYSDEEESTIEQIKIRLLDGPTFKTIPNEFKSLSIFHHPIHLIKEFSFSNVNMIFMKLFRLQNKLKKLLLLIQCKPLTKIEINIQDSKKFWHTLDARIEGVMLEYTPCNTMVTN